MKNVFAELDKHNPWVITHGCVISPRCGSVLPPAALPMVACKRLLMCRPTGGSKWHLNLLQAFSFRLLAEKIPLVNSFFHQRDFLFFLGGQKSDMRDISDGGGGSDIIERRFLSL